MSPRPRRNSDLEILYAAFRAIARFGPVKLTLADVAREAGVSPASLVQRFGSKRALLLAASADAAGGHVFIFEGLRARHRSTKGAVLGLAECMSVLGDTPEQVAHSLAFLQLDLTDPEFREQARQRSRGFHAGLVALVKDGIAAGEFIPCDASRLARALQATLNGAILDWTIHRAGTMAAWIRRDLRMMLTPYCRPASAPDTSAVSAPRRRSAPRASSTTARTPAAASR
jgi:AcrR family transcriptional regulator